MKWGALVVNNEHDGLRGGMVGLSTCGPDSGTWVGVTVLGVGQGDSLRLLACGLGNSM